MYISSRVLIFFIYSYLSQHTLYRIQHLKTFSNLYFFKFTTHFYAIHTQQSNNLVYSVLTHFIKLLFIPYENNVYKEESYLLQLTLQLLHRLLVIWFLHSYNMRILTNIRLQTTSFCLINLVHKSMQRYF